MITQIARTSSKNQKTLVSPLEFIKNTIRNLKPFYRNALNALIYLDNKYEYIYPSQFMLGKWAGVSRGTINQDVLPKLDSLGLIIKRNRNTYETCDYIIPALFRDPHVRRLLCSLLPALAILPVSLLKSYCQQENIEPKTSKYYFYSCLVTPSIKDNIISNHLHEKDDIKKVSHVMDKTDFLKKDPEKREFADLAGLYQDIGRQSLTESQWESFCQLDIPLIKKALVKLNGAIIAGTHIKHPWIYFYKIISSLKATAIPTQSFVKKSSASIAPVTQRESTYIPKYLKREEPLEPLSDDNPWNIPYPW